MNFKEILQKIEVKQQQSFYPLPEFRERGTKLLPVKSRGLYWLWTKLDFSELGNCLDTDGHKGEVPIRKLIEARKDLSFICNIRKDDFRIVYNGIGGYKIRTSGYGLRGRILQELNAKNVRTGSLNLMNRGFKPEDWAVSFFDFDAPENHEIIKELREEGFYTKYAADLEMLWRLEYGHPILCRH
ncbi:hypothetical protein ACLI1A_11965 [Flavobacterium sp. RHBU_3]|uniref:hypothetical protein n=1 Tax=Flavobacterium sp. RHBU_3 TaxID=3391184 RepID=UPI003984B6A7